MSAEWMLDLRGLEHPEPLLRALAALNELAAGEYLRLLSHRDPLLLYPLLAQQGFAYERPAEQAKTVEVLIWREGDAVAEQGVRDRPRAC
jgi:tRNA 2-thiouridine synthesizing protein A